MHLSTLGSNLFLLVFRSMNVNCTPTHKWLTLGLFSYHASDGVLPSRDLVGLLLTRYAALDSTFAHNLCGSLESASIDQTVSTSVWFTLMDMPFCSGILGIVYWCSIPYFFYFLDVHLPPVESAQYITNLYSIMFITRDPESPGIYGI